MAKVCVFCGGRPTTREHVYAAWLRDALPVGTSKFKTTDADGNPMWEQTTFDIIAKVACATCNNGWMSDLEAACKPLLIEAILYGAEFDLNRDQQRTVALWAIK